MVLSTALMMWKGLSVVCNTESPIVVVLRWALISQFPLSFVQNWHEVSSWSPTVKVWNLPFKSVALDAANNSTSEYKADSSTFRREEICYSWRCLVILLSNMATSQFTKYLVQRSPSFTELSKLICCEPLLSFSSRLPKFHVLTRASFLPSDTTQPNKNY